jgi:hypothetical protein
LDGPVEARECPYLDTINRHVLDFDFEKLCSVSLSRINVYACLVCGKYFQGTSPCSGAVSLSSPQSDLRKTYVFLQAEDKGLTRTRTASPRANTTCSWTWLPWSSTACRTTMKSKVSHLSHGL